MVGGKYTAARFSWLESYLINEEEITSLEISKRRAQIELNRWLDGDLQNVKIQKGSHSSRLEDTIAEFDKKLSIDYEMRDLTLDLIDHFDGIENQILRRKYIDGMSLMDIADIPGIGYSYGTIKNIHAELRRRLKFLEKWDIPEKVISKS